MERACANTLVPQDVNACLHVSLPARDWEGTVARWWLALTGRGIAYHADDVSSFESLFGHFFRRERNG